jgi:hypothetical protein
MEIEQNDGLSAQHSQQYINGANGQGPKDRTYGNSPGYVNGAGNGGYHANGVAYNQHPRPLSGNF